MQSLCFWDYCSKCYPRAWRGRAGAYSEKYSKSGNLQFSFDGGNLSSCNVSRSAEPCGDRSIGKWRRGACGNCRALFWSGRCIDPCGNRYACMFKNCRRSDHKLRRETFEEMVPKGPSYKVWAVGFCVISFVIANLGLNSIIAYSVPVLMFLYPLAITLILLTIFGKCFGNDAVMYRWVTGFTAVASVVDFVNALPEAAQKFLHLGTFVETAKSILPFADLGFGWVCPALLGLVIGTVHVMIRKKEVRG